MTAWFVNMHNNEYFLVQHTLSINLQSVEQTQLPSDQCAFENEIPGPFRMASDLSAADASILVPLKLNSDNTQALWAYLQAQNQKINTLLSYVLSQQDEAHARYQTLKFSAGSLIIKADSRWKIDDQAKLKIFLPDESAAIYCYAIVSEANEKECMFNYTFIREQDRELLIRASLHVQSQQLKQRAKQRELNP
jgi:hypothetical protein